MTELTITSPNVHAKVDYNTFTMDNPMPKYVYFWAQKSAREATYLSRFHLEILI